MGSDGYRVVAELTTEQEALVAQLFADLRVAAERERARQEAVGWLA